MFVRVNPGTIRRSSLSSYPFPVKPETRERPLAKPLKDTLRPVENGTAPGILTVPWRPKLLKKMARSERFELPTFWSVARRSIQLSYERAVLVTLMLTSACSAVKQ